MVGNMIRVLRARMTLLAVDEAGMSTVEYSNVEHYNRIEGDTVPSVAQLFRRQSVTAKP